ncbi:MAG TPA: AMP-dependent synthetase/ligase [Frankiaceae bacterium]|nr:AMP-dependent synthetase/ligase [Frankiaceae bacterium]
METFAVPPLHNVEAGETTLDALVLQAETAPSQAGFSSFDGERWQPLSYRAFLDQARAIARGLLAANVMPGERVALMSRTRLEWALFDYAVWLAGAVTVPIYETSSAEQVEWILSDSEAVAILVEADHHAQLVETVRASAPQLRSVWQIDAGDLDQLATGQSPGPGADASTEAKASADADADAELARRRSEMGAGSLATIVYTSGTTGRPKGCALSHGNLVATYSNTREAPGIPDIFNDQASTLLFLPLAHCLARIIQLSCINAGVTIAYAPELKDLPKHLASFQPTLLLSVPRVFEKLYNTARHTAHARRQGRVFDWAEQVAVNYSMALDGDGPGLGLRVRHELFDRLVYRKLRAAMGGRMRWSVSGGAPLGARLGHFFRGSGVTVLEGWGLSETATGGTLNLPAQQRIGSVGRPVPGCAVRVAADGELLVRAGFVMPGYWHNEVATKEVLDDEGWFHTGDVGEIDGDGYVFITGRKKELLVTSGGKNIAPTVLEDRLRAHELVSQCIVVGDNRPYVTCLLTLDEDALQQWAADHGHRGLVTAVDLRDDPELQNDLQRAVDTTNGAVSRAEAIRRWRVLDRDFTEAGGELTPTLKLRRQVILEHFSADVAALYDE